MVFKCDLSEPHYFRKVLSDTSKQIQEISWGVVMVGKPDDLPMDHNFPYQKRKE